MTGKEIFMRALDLCALRGEGDQLPGDIGDLRGRAIGILNVLLAEEKPFAERLTGRTQSNQEVYSLEEALRMETDVCACVLPYALASRLISPEDPQLAQELEQKAAQARQKLLQDGYARRHAITEVYG